MNDNKKTNQKRFLLSRQLRTKIVYYPILNTYLSVPLQFFLFLTNPQYNTLSAPEEAGIQTSKADDNWDNLIVPHNELGDCDSTDLPDRIPSSLTTENVEKLSNATLSSAFNKRSKSSRASTDNSDSVEVVAKQEEK